MSLNLDGLTDAQLRLFALKCAKRSSEWRAMFAREAAARSADTAAMAKVLAMMTEDYERAEQQRILDEIRKEVQP